MTSVVGRATRWLSNKKHSHVRVISYADSERMVIQFQNEKFEVVEFELNPEDLIALFKQEKFMEVETCVELQGS
jgi:hypothetical protein